MGVHAYPADLADFVRTRWRALDAADGAQTVLGGALPDRESLARFFSAAYQASLLREEERAVIFRVVLADPEAFLESEGPPDGLHRLTFAAPRPYSAHELLRLAPAAKYHRSLVGVAQTDDGEFAIWGILHSGPRWLVSTKGGRGGRSSMDTAALVVRVTGPGRLAVSRGDELLCELRSGKLSGPMLDVFQSAWLPACFARERAELAALHERQRGEQGAAWGMLADDLAGRISQQMVKRLIATVRAAHHGGTIVMLPGEDAETLDATPDVLRIKYPFRDDGARRRARKLILDTLAAVAKAAGPGGFAEPAGWDFYEAVGSAELSSLDEGIFELSHLCAALADVDGAVVMTKRFELLGFGAEIGPLPEVRRVRRAMDLEAQVHEEEDVERVGTRHRSAFRLCQRFPGAVVIVVSQDGNVRFVTWHAGGVTYWDHGSADWVDVLAARAVQQLSAVGLQLSARLGRRVGGAGAPPGSRGRRWPQHLPRSTC